MLAACREARSGFLTASSFSAVASKALVRTVSSTASTRAACTPKLVRLVLHQHEQYTWHDLDADPLTPGFFLTQLSQQSLQLKEPITQGHVRTSMPPACRWVCLGHPCQSWPQGPRPSSVQCQIVPCRITPLRNKPHATWYMLSVSICTTSLALNELKCQW